MPTLPPKNGKCLDCGAKHEKFQCDDCDKHVVNAKQHVSLNYTVSSVITLTMPGNEIFERTSCDDECCHEVGAYTLRNVACSADEPIGFQVGPVLRTHAQFDPSQFRRDPLEYLLMEDDEVKDYDGDGLGDELIIYIIISVSKWHHLHSDEEYRVKASLYSICPPAETSCSPIEVDTSEEALISVTPESFERGNSHRRLALHFDGGMLRKTAEDIRIKQPNANTTTGFVLRKLEMSGSKPENIIFLESPEGATKMYQMMDFIHKEVDHCGLDVRCKKVIQVHVAGRALTVLIRNIV